MRLRSTVAKADPGGVHRETSAMDTYRRIEPHLRRIGLTRIADITGLDRIGIPVFNAICPRANDTVSVYSGKGTSPTDARTSAVMEAVERFCAGLPLRPEAVDSYTDLRRQGRPAVPPAEFLIERSPGYHDGQVISWVSGYDLVADAAVLVPAHALAYGAAGFHEPGCFAYTTTNGLAAGNSLEEAICHALTEVIERDAYTLAEVVDRQLPVVLRRRLGAEAGRRIAARLPGRPPLDPGSLPAAATDLVERFTAAGVAIHLTDITSDLGIPTFRAISVEDLGSRTSAGHHGVGTHPDAQVALVRALTECAQSRAVDIQAMREDIHQPGADVPDTLLHVRRATPRELADHLPPPGGEPRRFDEIRSYRHDDLMADIGLLLERLCRAGCRQVVAVDVSAPDLPATVVRVLVPGAESWGIDRGRLGRRAARAWRTALAGITGQPGDVAPTAAVVLVEPAVEALR
ncbi:YcaO-like family protein [Solwaraspora sp. WMMB335]|uniref:YcaO-like family protein n=1 Tax=Solwaraspora sp. WMMB335 TaxID=3404118 RepID=UPI003B9637EE